MIGGDDHQRVAWTSRRRREGPRPAPSHSWRSRPRTAGRETRARRPAADRRARAGRRSGPRERRDAARSRATRPRRARLQGRAAAGSSATDEVPPCRSGRCRSRSLAPGRCRGSTRRRPRTRPCDTRCARRTSASVRDPRDSAKPPLSRSMVSRRVLAREDGSVRGRGQRRVRRRVDEGHASPRQAGRGWA